MTQNKSQIEKVQGKSLMQRVGQSKSLSKSLARAVSETPFQHSGVGALGLLCGYVNISDLLSRGRIASQISGTERWQSDAGGGHISLLFITQKAFKEICVRALQWLNGGSPHRTGHRDNHLGILSNGTLVNSLVCSYQVSTSKGDNSECWP